MGGAAGRPGMAGAPTAGAPAPDAAPQTLPPAPSGGGYMPYTGGMMNMTGQGDVPVGAQNGNVVTQMPPLLQHLRNGGTLENANWGQLNAMQRGMVSQPPGLQMIQRYGYNPYAYLNAPAYAGDRAPQMFKPGLVPNQPGAAQQQTPQQAEDINKLRQELDALRAWQSQTIGSDRGGH